MTNSTNILASLVEAASALEARPSLEARIRELENEIAIRDERLAMKDRMIEDTKAHLDATTATLKAKEVEIENATFRALELEEKLETVDKLVSLIQSGANQIVAAVKPEPEPVKEEPKPVVTEDGPVVIENTTPIYHSTSNFAPVSQDAPNPSYQPTPPTVHPWDRVEPTIPVDGYHPGDMANRPWWMRPDSMSEARFVELGGQRKPDHA